MKWNTKNYIGSTSRGRWLAVFKVSGIIQGRYNTREEANYIKHREYGWWIIKVVDSRKVKIVKGYNYQHVVDCQKY